MTTQSKRMIEATDKMDFPAPKVIEMARPHKLVRIQTHYNRAGAGIGTDVIVMDTVSDADAAFRSLFTERSGRVTFVNDNLSRVHEVHNENGETIALYDFYAAVVGEDVFITQLLDPDFSINLETWLGEYVAAHDAAIIL